MKLTDYPSDAAIITARQTLQNTPNDFNELYTRYPDEAFTATEAAYRLLNHPTICEQLYDRGKLDTENYCGGCKVPLD